MSRVEPVRALDPSRTITVISGMPRSGTSMMMQMLEAAGLELATDGLRGADPANPKGYYELDAVKRLPNDSSFLSSIVGQVVKVVSPLLLYLPPEYDFRVIMMERNLDELLASQRVMLDRRGGADLRRVVDDEALAHATRHQLERVNLWLAEQENFRVCSVSHRLMVRSPEEAAEAVFEFLDETGAFVTTTSGSGASGAIQMRMAAVVDPDLHRQRGNP